jgi:hypothetical protein
LPPPPLIALKDQIWHGLGNAIDQDMAPSAHDLAGR